MTLSNKTTISHLMHHKKIFASIKYCFKNYKFIFFFLVVSVRKTENYQKILFI